MPSSFFDWSVGSSAFYRIDVVTEQLEITHPCARRLVPDRGSAFQPTRLFLRWSTTAPAVSAEPGGQLITLQEFDLILRDIDGSFPGGQLWTVINTPDGVETPLYIAVMGWSPLPRDAGSITLN